MVIVAAILVVATLVAMTTGRVPAVLALGIAICIAGILQIAPAADLFAGLSNGGVITVGGMLVIAKGVVKTGVISRATWQLLSTVTTAQQALRRLITPIGIASGLMNTTPIVAMLVPASRELEQTRGIPARQVLLPIAHATTLAGSVTLIGTSSNLLIAGIAAGSDVHMSMLSFAPVALPVCLVGWVVLLILAPRMPRGSTESEAATRSWRVEIPVSQRANAIGRVPETIGIASTQEYRLGVVQRQDEELPPTIPLQAGDLLIYQATEAGVAALWGSPRFGLSPQKLYLVSMGMGEHGNLRDLEAAGDVRVIAAQTDRDFIDTVALPGSTCFVTTRAGAALHQHDDFALSQDAVSRAPQPRKTGVALGILAAVIVAASFGLTPVEIAATSGAILMVLTGVLTPRSAVRALDWNVLFILAGSIGLGAIVVESGLAAKIAEAIRWLSAGHVPLVVVVFAVTTAILTNLVTNAAAASILTPVALSIAAEMGFDPVTLLALIGTCISFTFINPFSHQSNLMVMRPGGYSTASFARFGVPLVAVSLITVSVVGYVLISP